MDWSEFSRLKELFFHNKGADNSTKLLDAEKLLAAILTIRYDLSDQNIGSMIMPGAVPATIKSYRNKVIPRMIEVLADEPMITGRLCYKPGVLNSTMLPPLFPNLEDFHT